MTLEIVLFLNLKTRYEIVFNLNGMPILLDYKYFWAVDIFVFEQLCARGQNNVLIVGIKKLLAALIFMISKKH